MTLPESVKVVPEVSRNRLTERQAVNYEVHREKLLTWLYGFGKTPDSAEGYSESTLQNTAYRLDAFYRYVWDQEGYTTDIDHSHADAYLRELATSDESQSHKSTAVTALKRLFKWKVHQQGGEPWESELSFPRNDSASNPRDYLSKDERKLIRETALEYGSIPGYNDLTPEERERWKIHLAQRFEKPKEEVSPDDWSRANGWKIPSLVWTSPT